MFVNRIPEHQKHVQIETIRAFLEVAKLQRQVNDDPKLDKVISEYRQILSMIEKPEYKPR